MPKPDLRTLLQLQVPVIVRIGERHMPVDDVLALGPGAIVELTKNADEELELLINNKKIGGGVAVKVGENFGLRISNIEAARDRVEAMGAGEQ